MNTQVETQQDTLEQPWEKSQDPKVLKARIKQLEESMLDTMASHSGEAGGTAWTEIYTEKGTRITLSNRGVNATEALIGLVDAVRFARDNYKMTGAGSLAAPRPAENLPVVSYDPPAQHDSASGNSGNGNGDSGKETVEVTALVLTFKKTGGEPYLMVKCAKYPIHGVPAYLESLPPAIKDSIQTMFRPSVDTQPPANLKRAVIVGYGDGKHKVERFLS